MIEGMSSVTDQYSLADPVSAQESEALVTALEVVDGVETVTVVRKTVSVDHYREILSREAIRRELLRLGVRLGNNARPGNPFKRFVNRLADSNSKTFGDQPLDCCTLNKKEGPGA